MTQEMMTQEENELETESWSCRAGAATVACEPELQHGVNELEAEHELQMESHSSSGADGGVKGIERRARELETLETLDSEHIPSLDLVSWLYQGPYEDENGSLTSSDHDDGFF